MRGEFVIVRDAWGKPNVRRVWEADVTHVYICTDERFQRLSKDYGSDFPPTGFPRGDVFYYDPVTLERLKDSPDLWDNLKKFDKKEPWQKR